MKTNQLINFSIDRENKKVNVKREFAAPIDKVWAAWTESKLLDQWWAPKPWKARTKTMDFREGGHWIYAMVGPNDEVHWSRADFLSINPLKSFSGRDSFCDENGEIDRSLPVAIWTSRFSERAGATLVSVEVQYDKLADLEKVIEMGFKEGFEAALDNLDDLISSHKIK